MKNVALLFRLVAKQGKKKQVAHFITNALPLAVAEVDNSTWYAIQIDKLIFGIFDTFPHEEVRHDHLSGNIAKVLFANASDLLSDAAVIEQVTVLTSK